MKSLNKLLKKDTPKKSLNMLLKRLSSGSKGIGRIHQGTESVECTSFLDLVLAS